MGQQHGTRSVPPEGALIEETRKFLGTPRAEVAAKLGCSETRYRVLVSGRVDSDGKVVHPRPETWARLANAVGVPPEMFEELKSPRRDIARLMRAFTSVTKPSTITDDPEQSLVQILATIRTTFGEEVFSSAVKAVLRRGRRRRHGTDREVSM